jgi:8-oxo-dGTP pyrophosphatase MutT (NUDIX family)
VRPDRTGSSPALTVAAVIENDGLFMLVEERIEGRLVLNQPAGHVENGETLVAAVVRETIEETAFNFIPEATIGAYLWGRSAGGPLYLRVAFAGRHIPHDGRRTLDEGIERVLWLTRSELAASNDRLRSPMVLRVVDDYLSGIRHPVHFLQDLTLDELALRAAVL